MQGSAFSTIHLFFLIGFLLFACTPNKIEDQFTNPKEAIAFSQQFLLAQKSGNETLAFIDTLKKTDPHFLAEELTTDAEKLSFWINCYNALVQVQLQKDSTSFKNREVFFNKRSINFGGEFLSFNDIENGILRNKTIKEKEQFIKQFRPIKLEYRIHFTLNCGAKSCPPIAYYDPKDLEQQLFLAEKSFVSTNAKYNSEKNEVEISELFNWFKEDFGGDKGITEILKRHQIIPVWSQAKIVYLPYDWTVYTKNFQE